MHKLFNPVIEILNGTTAKGNSAGALIGTVFIGGFVVSVAERYLDDEI